MKITNTLIGAVQFIIVILLNYTVFTIAHQTFNMLKWSPSRGAGVLSVSLILVSLLGLCMFMYDDIKKERQDE